ncbi:MAG: hypothetical protein U0736_18270 [Gemmataceae bacterium]
MIGVTANLLQGKTEQPSASVAGAFSWNSLGGDLYDTTGTPSDRRLARAFIADTTVTADDVAVRATTDDFAVTVTAGIGSAKPNYVANIAGSATVGVYSSLTEAYLGDRPNAPTAASTSVTARGNVDVAASDNLFLVSVTGALSLNGKAALGAAVEVGVFENDVTAFVGDGVQVRAVDAVGNPTGNVRVTASSTQQVVSVAAAIALLATDVALPFSLTTQNVTNNVVAYVGANAVIVGRDVTVAATEDLKLTAVGGSAAYSKPSAGAPVGVGLAFALVDVDRNVEASIHSGANVRATGPNGLAVTASGVETINTAAGSGSGGQQIVVTLSPAVTEITGSVVATVDRATVTASRVAVTADSAPNLFNLAIAGSVAITTGGSTPPPPGPGAATQAATDGQPYVALPVTLAGAGAGSGAYIRNRVESSIIDGSTITTTTGGVTVTATDRSVILADAGGIAITIRKGNQASGSGVTGSVGASAAINDIATAVTARIYTSSVIAAGDVLVTANSSPKIRALTIGAAGGVTISGGQGFSAAFAGAGSGSGNQVANTVQALIVGSTVDSTGGQLRVTATDASVIYADAGAFAVALSLAQQGAASVNLAVGASAAANQVTNVARAAVLAFSTVSAAGDVTVAALSTSRIDTLTIAGALSATIAGGGSAATINFAGAGAGSGNQIANTIDARIDGGSATSDLGQVTVTATDAASIHADAGAVAIAAAIASRGTVGVRGSIGASIGVNDVANQTTAVLNGTTVRAPAGVTVAATETATIDVLTLAGAGSIAAGGAGTIGVSFAGAGAGSGNSIHNQTIAEVRGGSAVTADAGSLSVSAFDLSIIRAEAYGAAIAVSANGGNNVSVAIGAAASTNDIGNTTRAGFLGSTLTRATTVTLAAREAATIQATAVAATLSVAGGSASVSFSGGGAFTKNVIADTTTATVDVSGLTSTGAVTVSAQDSAGIQATVIGVSAAAAFGSTAGVGAAVGIGAASNAITDTVASIVDSSTVRAGGAVNVTVRTGESVEAITIGAALAVGGGGSAGIGVGGAGAGSGNSVHVDALATIRDRSTVTTTVGGVTVAVEDTSDILADAGGLAISTGVGEYAGVGTSLGVAYASNDVQNSVRALIDASDVTAAAGVAVSAIEGAYIRALSLAGAVAVGAAVFGGVAVAGAGAASYNTIRSTVQAAIDHGDGHTVEAKGGTVTVSALDDSTINASSGGVSASFGAGAVGVGVTVGASILKNDVGNVVQAFASGGTVKATGDITLTATEKVNVSGLSIGGAASGAVGALAGVAASGAGAEARNVIANRTEASARNGSLISSGGGIGLTATDTTTADAQAVAGALAVAGGGFGSGAVAVGASVASNDFRSLIAATTDGATLDAAGAVTIRATSTTTAHVLTVAASVAAAIGPTSVAFAGGGADSDTTVVNTVQASVSGGRVTTHSGDVTVAAVDTATLTTEVGTGTFAGAGLSASVSVSTASSTDTSVVRAYLDGAQVSAGGNVVVTASAGGSMNTNAIATSIAITGPTGAGATADSTRALTVEAYTAGQDVSAGQDVTVSADTTGSVQTSTAGLAGGLLAIGVSLAGSVLRDNVSARTGGRTTGRKVRVAGRSEASTAATARALTGGIVAGFGARADAVSEPIVVARTEGTIDAQGDVTVDALARPTVTATARGGAFGGVTVGMSLARGIAAPTAQAVLSGYSTVAGGSVSVTGRVDLAANEANARASAGGLLAALSGAQADAISGPVVDARISAGNTVSAGQDVTVAASSTGRTSAVTDGLTIAGIFAGADRQANAAVGTASLSGIIDVSSRPAHTTAAANDQAAITAGRNLTITASSSQVVTSDATGAVGALIAAGGAQATTVRNVPTTASVDRNAVLTAGSDVTIDARNGYALPGGIGFVDNVSAVANNSVGGFVAAGAPTAITTVGDRTDAQVGDQARITARAGNVTVRATAADFGITSAATAKGGGVIAIVDADATTTTNNPATAAVGDGASVAAGTDLLIVANTGLQQRALAKGSGKGLGAVSLTHAEVGGAARASSAVGHSASLTAGRELQVLAGETDLMLSLAYAEVTGGAGIIKTTADARSGVEHHTDVTVDAGARLVGPSLLRLRADVGTQYPNLITFADQAIAISDAGGFAGSTNAEATNVAFRSASVTVIPPQQAGDPPATFRTSNLDVLANAYTPLLVTQAQQKGFVLIDVGDSKKTELGLSQAPVAFNGDVTITGPATFVRIDPAGTVTTSSNVGVDKQPGWYAISPVTATGGGQATVRSVGGLGSLVTGTAAFHFDRGSSGVSIINEDTSRDLIVSDVAVAVPTDAATRLTITPQGPSHFTADTTDQGGVPVRITSTSDVVLTGVIDNPSGPVTIAAPYGAITSERNRYLWLPWFGGSSIPIVLPVESAPPSQQRIVSPQVTLTAAGIGGPSSRVSVRSVQSAGGPALTATSTGDLYLNLSAVNPLNANPPAIAATLTGRTVDLTVQDSGAASSYAITVNAAELNADAGLATPVDLAFTAAGDLPVGTVVSHRGDVTLTAGGAIRATRPGGTPDVAGADLTLTAGTTIGPLGIDSSLAGAGIVTATAAGAITLDETAGDLTLNRVKSANGTITLNAAGAILDGRSGVGAPPVNLDTPGRAVLTAGTGIGVGSPLLTKIAELQANAGTGVLNVSNANDLTIPADGAFGLQGQTITVTTGGGLTVAKEVAAVNSVLLTAGGAIDVRRSVRSGNRTALTGTTITLVDGATVQGWWQTELNADSRIEVRAGSQVAANPQGGYLYLRTTGTGNFANILIDGDLNAYYAYVNTGSGNFDVITIRQMPHIPYVTLYDTGGFGNGAIVPGTAGNDTFNVSAREIDLAGVITFGIGGGLQLIDINSLGGNDTFNVTGTAATAETRLFPRGNAILNLSTNGTNNGKLTLDPFWGPTTVVNLTADYRSTAPYSNDLTVSNGSVLGLGLNATFAGARAINVRLSGEATDLTLPAPGVLTTVQTGAAAHTVTVGTGDLGGFSRPLTVTAVPGAGTSLHLDNHAGLNPSATLTATSAQGFGGAGVVSYSGIDALTVDAGNGTLTVLGTIAGPVAITTGYKPDLAAADNTVRVIGSASSRLTITSTGTADALVFDGSNQPTAVNATLSDGTAAGTTDLTGFAAVGPVTFSGFVRADLIGTAGNDALSLRSTVPTLRVTARGGSGDDTFTVRGVAVPGTTGSNPTRLVVTGDGGDDTVVVPIAGSPADAAYQGLTYLKSTAEHLIVDNTANPNAVNWVTTSGAVLGYDTTPLLDISGADEVAIRGGSSPQNTLRVDAGAIAQKGTVDGNKVTLRSNGLVQFTRLSGAVSTYAEGDFVLRGATSTGQPNIQADSTFGPAFRAVDPSALLSLSAADGGLFDLYSIDLAGIRPGWSIVGLTATGQSVTATFDVNSPAGFQTFTLGESFRNLVSVSFTLDALRMTRLIATETLRAGTINPVNPLLTPAALDSLVVVSGVYTGYITTPHGGTFTLHSIDITLTGVNTQSVVFTGTTAAGGTVTRVVPRPNSRAEETVIFGPEFSNLVSLDIAAVLLPGEQGSPGVQFQNTVTTYSPPAGNVTPVAPAAGVMPTHPQNVVFGANGITIDGQSPPAVYDFTRGGYLGIFNGTPFGLGYDAPTGSSALVFYGDLNIPAGSTVTFAGTAPLTLYVLGDVNVGAGSVIDAPPGLLGGGAGGLPNSTSVSFTQYELPRYGNPDGPGGGYAGVNQLELHWPGQPYYGRPRGGDPLGRRC